MITEVSVVTVIVPDQDEALQFYTEKLGFRKKTDVRIGPNAQRWVSVVPETGRGPELTLFNPRSLMDQAAAEEMLHLIGKMPGIVLGTDDCRKTAAELEAKGVQIVRPPQEQPYGLEAVFVDPYGNYFLLVQPSEQPA